MKLNIFALVFAAAFISATPAPAADAEDALANPSAPQAPAQSEEAPEQADAKSEDGKKKALEAKKREASERARSLERARQVLHYVNIERKKRGKKPLQISDRCQRKAEARAKAICRRFNHKGAFGGLGCYKWKAENIAKGQRSPRAVVRAWMRSKGHRKNMMSGKYDFMGIGYCRGRWVQTLGGGKTKVWGKNKPKKIIHRRPKKKKVKKIRR
jgi:uncharacterized protein YkwD